MPERNKSNVAGLVEQPAGVAFVLIQSCPTACSVCQDKVNVCERGALNL